MHISAGGVHGFLHKSQISLLRVYDVRNLFEIGQTVHVIVSEINEEVKEIIMCTVGILV